MWFKSASIYRLPVNWGATAEALEQRFAARPILACGAMDSISRGWSEPANDGRYVVSVAGHLVVALTVEKKNLPGSVVNELAAAKAREIEAMQGYKPGRKQMREIKEAALHELLPRAFSVRRRILAWIDPVGGWLVIDTPSPSRAEEVLDALRDTLEEFPVKMLRTNLSPVSVMCAWLAAGKASRETFSIDSDCKLYAVSDSNASVRYTHHALDGKDVQDHLAAGKLPEALGMTFDDRVSFILTEKGVMKRLAFLDVVKEEAREKAESNDLQFEADVAIMTGEMSRLITELVEALGGEAPADLVDSVKDAPYGEGDENDPLYEKAVLIVTQTGRPSTAMIQRHLRIGYNRAARLLEQMERSGILTPMNSNGVREIATTQGAQQ